MLHITYFTDPLCCWSWGFEPQWRRLLFEYEGSIAWEVRMGGLLPDWKTFHDAENHVSRPIQMGPVWMHAASVTGMPMNTRIWMDDPPVSSYPACIAVCTARLQSQAASDKYLRMLRQALMMDGMNIARAENLRAIAKKLTLEKGINFDLERFNEDFDNGNGIEAFRTDINRVRLQNINRYPTLIIKANNGRAIIITGYRHYTDIQAAIQGLDPELQKTVNKYSPDDYRLRWPDATTRELEEISTPAFTPG